MSILTYLLGVCISAVAWFILIKVRQAGFYIPMPEKFGGNLLDPLDHKYVDWGLLMLGWCLISVLWPLGWTFLIGIYALAWLITVIVWLWERTIGNEDLARKIFGGK